MKRLQDRLTMAMVRAAGGVIIARSRTSGWFEKRAYHAECFRNHSFTPYAIPTKLYYLLPDEMSKPHWNRRQCHRCHRLLKNPPPELT